MCVDNIKSNLNPGVHSMGGHFSHSRPLPLPCRHMLPQRDVWPKLLCQHICYPNVIQGGFLSNPGVPGVRSMGPVV